MPGIMGPGGVPSPADIARAMGKKAPYQPINKFATMTLREKQKFLADLGYAIDVDGQWGPQTEGAWGNYASASKKGLNFNKAAKYWSSASKLSNDYVKPSSKSKGSSSPGAAVSFAAPSPQPTVTMPKATKSGGGGPRVAPLNLRAQLAALQRNIINPQQFMKMFTDSQAPALAALQQEISRRESRPSQVDDNLRQWYESMIGQVNAGAGATSAASSRIMAAGDAATAGLVNTLGGSASPAAAGAAQQGTINRGMLEQLTAAQDSFEASQGRNLALEGVEKRMAARGEEQSMLDELRLKLIELQGGMGQGKADAWLQALQLRDQQLNGIADLKGIMSMAGFDAANANQKLTAGALANKRAALDYDIDAIKLAMGLQKQGQGPITPWGQLDPGQLQGLRKELLGGAVNDQNVLLYDPMTTYNTMGSTLRSLSQGQWNPFNNAQIDRWRDDLLRSMLPGWNKANPKRKWAFNKKGKLVRI